MRTSGHPTLIACGIAAVMLASCGVGPHRRAGPSTCYPSWPTVTPTVARAGATVRVESQGIRDCTYAHRLGSYELRLQTKPIGLDRTGASLGTVAVGPRSRVVGAQVQIPADTPPGRYYVKYARAPTDHFTYSTGCDDVRVGAGPQGARSVTLVSCSVAPPNLVVVP